MTFVGCEIPRDIRKRNDNVQTFFFQRRQCKCKCQDR